MKLLLPAALACLTIACAAPKPGTAAHQRQLAEQARENFLAMKELERKSNPPVARAEPPPRPRLKPFAAQSSLFSNPFASAKPRAETEYTPPPPKRVAPAAPKTAAKPPKPAKPVAAAKPAPLFKLFKPSAISPAAKPRRSDDTVYYYDVPYRKEPTSSRYRNYKRQYAQAVGKRPEDLSLKEREWVQAHYRD